MRPSALDATIGVIPASLAFAITASRSAIVAGTSVMPTSSASSRL